SSIARAPPSSPLSFQLSFLFMLPPSPRSSLFPYTTLFRSLLVRVRLVLQLRVPYGDSGDPRGPLGVGDIHRHVVGALLLEGERRSEEHTSELQSLRHLVCRLLLEKKKKKHSTTDNREDSQT